MQRYLETRTTDQTNTTAADVARHLLARQHLGKAVVVCAKPVTTMSVTKKYWLKLARNLQKERASTLNVERILQLTHDITRMHHTEFAAKPYDEAPQADVFFVTPDSIGDLPPRCYSFYILDAPTETTLLECIRQLPHRSLVVDYTRHHVAATVPLLPKHQLERQIPELWRGVETFLEAHDVHLDEMAMHPTDTRAIDHAIDDLLDVGNQFLRIANDFLELLRLVQPTSTPMAQQKRFDLLMALSRRIHALTPGTLSQQFINSLNDDDSPMMLRDIASERYSLALA